MARLKTHEDKRIPVLEDEYLRLMENTMVLEALKIACLLYTSDAADEL